MKYPQWWHYARGCLLHFFGFSPRAFAAFGTAYLINPQDARAARQMAGIAAEKQDFASAEKWFETTLALAPDDGVSWFNLGYVRENTGKPHAAIAAFSEAVRLVPTQDRAWYGMGLAHARLGRHSEAAAALEKAVTLQPMNGEGWYQLGMAYHYANRPEQVSHVMQRLLEFEPMRAKKLAGDSGRTDLMALMPPLPF